MIIQLLKPTLLLLIVIQIIPVSRQDHQVIPGLMTEIIQQEITMETEIPETGGDNVEKLLFELW